MCGGGGGSKSSAPAPVKPAGPDTGIPGDRFGRKPSLITTPEKAAQPTGRFGSELGAGGPNNPDTGIGTKRFGQDTQGGL